MDLAAIDTRKYETDGDYVAVQAQYDALGRAFKTSNPFRPTEIDGSHPILWTQIYFDALGRATKVKTPDNAELLTSYSGNATTVTDQAGKLRRSIVNGIGQLTRVDEPDNSSSTGSLGSISSPNQATSYTYDVLNNLLTVTQGSQTRTFTYDSLSRLLTAANPESGTIRYSYDANGNLQTKWDARDIKTIYDYDVLNRVTKRCYKIRTSTLGAVTCAAASGETAESNTPTVDYTYRTSAPAIGTLSKVESSVSTTEYTSFDVLGRVTASKQTTDGVTYGNGTTDSPMTYTYNLSGALIEQQYPSGRKVQVTLDNDGSLAQVKSRKNVNAGYWAYANSFSYNAAGALTSMQLGNGRWESTTFNNRLQPTQIALGTTQGGSDKLDLDYTYGTSGTNNGNILTQTINVATVGASTGFAAVQTYNYDSLNRLKDATENLTPIGGSATETWKQSFTYDRYGNRNFLTGTGETTTLGNCATAVCNPSISASNNKITSTGYTFDSSGNTTFDAALRKFTYDAENKQVKVESTNSSQVVTGTVGEYFYDGDGKRVKKYVPPTETSPGETTILNNLSFSRIDFDSVFGYGRRRHVSSPSSDIAEG